MTDEILDLQKMREHEIGFEITEEDFVQFNLFHYQKTKVGKQYLLQTRLKALALVAVLFFIYGYFLATLLPLHFKLWVPILASILGTAAMYPLMLKAYPRAVRKMVKKLFKKEENKSLFCEHFLTVDEIGVSNRTAYSESKIAWGALERIETGENYTYLYIGTMQAHIIPHKSITQGDLGSFLNAIKTHYKPGQLLVSAERTAM